MMKLRNRSYVKYSTYALIAAFMVSMTPAGAMADVTLTKDENGVRIDDFGAIPLITHQQGYFTTYFWSEYSPEMYYESVGHIQDPTFTYEYCTDLIYSVFGDRVRP